MEGEIRSISSARSANDHTVLNSEVPIIILWES